LYGNRDGHITSANTLGGQQQMVLQLPYRNSDGHVTTTNVLEGLEWGVLGMFSFFFWILVVYFWDVVLVVKVEHRRED